MNLSAPFIDRPVATTLLTIGLVLLGAVAYRMLPVSPLPQVDFPTIQVQAQLPGASPEVMAATVATPLERQLGRIAGVTEITSSSQLGSTRVVLQFDLDRNINEAAIDVQAAINAARAQLPTSLPSNPYYRKVNPADAPIMIIALTSDVLTQGQMYDVASTIVAQKLSQVEGIGAATVGGSALPAVRVQLNPNALNKYGIGLDEVRTAIGNWNSNRPKGAVEGDGRYWQINANDQALRARDYVPMIVTYRNGAAVRLGDVAQVIDSVQDVRNAGSWNGRPSILVVLYREPNANIIETIERVKGLLPQLRASIPGSVDLAVTMDRTTTIRASLREVQATLLVAVALVILVVFVFLRSFRATLIPSVAVPVSLVSTFAVMYLCGYTLNNFSLMALIVAAGFVVDDAVVVLENTSRHIENGMAPRDAALRGASEVGFTVMSMSLSLIAVFIPILLMGGYVGRLFREFAVTLSAAILVSLLVSLTTTPALCASLLRARDVRRPAGRGFIFPRLRRGYAASLRWALRHSTLMLLLLVVTIALNVYLYVVIPKGFFPSQDTGRLYASVRGDQSASFQSTRIKLTDAINIVKDDPGVENVTGWTGSDARGFGMMFITLKPLEERKASAESIAARLRMKLANQAGVAIYVTPTQEVRVGGRDSDATFDYTLKSDDLDLLRYWTPRLERALRGVPQLVDVSSDQQTRGLQATLVIDRPTAARLGVTPDAIDTTLNLAFGQAIVGTMYSTLNQYRVVMEVDPRYAQDPEALKGVYVNSANGDQIPLSAFSRYEYTNTPVRVSHEGQFAAATISFSLPQGVALSEAIAKIEETMARIGVPTSIEGSFSGTAKAFRAALASQPWLILAALITMYIVLGVLYESYVHPLTILSTLPSAGVGALLALVAFKVEFSVMALIGVFLLIGIVKKNAIMMIDFALEAERREGKSPEEAILEAAVLRFRPIMMTTMAAILGALPLALGTGLGSELRQPLGIAVVGGLVMSQLLTLYTTPVVYLALDRLRWRWARAHGRDLRGVPV